MNQKNKNYTMMKRYSRKALITLALLTSAVGAKAQTNYVFMNGNNYYYVNNNAWSNTNTFSPSVIWTINNNVPYNNNRYLIITRGGNMGRTYTPSLNENTSTTYTFTISDGDYVNYDGRYLATTLAQMATNTNAASRITAYQVTTSTVSTTSTAPTINGADILTATGTSNYTATGAAYQAGGYTNYRFNSTDHFFNGNTAFTPAAATLGTATWTLSSTDYATVNSSGVVTVNSLPTSDVTVTLTVTIPVSGGTPAAPSGATLSATKEITIQGNTPSAPVIDFSGTSATITTNAAGSTTIRYTLDGTDPTATTGTVYSGDIDLSTSTTSPVTIKAVTIRNGNASVVTTETVTLTLPEPVITVNGDAGTATISATAGATIYYTTNGSDPTTSSTQYTSSLSGLSPMTTIKAIAVKSGWNNSPVVSTTITIPSSVSGGTVTIFDYEDHNWTYYSGVDSSVDGGNYNTDYEGKLYSPDPRNVKITYKANGGAVSIDESDTTFVYYKTIEKVNGAYNYTVISNPFSKRPNDKGFGGWRIKEGAEYINGYADEAVLPLDAELTLTGLDTNYTPNCTSAEIELEATWVNLNDITYASGNTFTYNVSGGTYETNILVLNRNVTGTITTTSPVTIMMVEPDGSSDYRGTFSFTGNITPNNDGVTKIEYSRWTTTNAINATGRDFTIGRGIVRPNGGGTLYGTNTNRNINQTFKVESGIYEAFYAIGANGPQDNMTKQHIILGNDYDRAKLDNDNLTITNNMMLLNRAATIGTDRLIVTAKSGKFTTELDHSTAQASSNCFYLWNNNSTNSSTGVRTLIIEGGEFWHIAGGVDYANSNDDVNLKIRMKGGTVHGSIYGGAARFDAHGGKQFVFTGGTVEGWIAGGSNGFLSEGTGNDNGSTQGNSYVYVGGTTQVNSGGSTTAINVSLGGNVYGAGCGNEDVNVSGRVTLGTNVVVADNSYVERGVYGGGAYGGSPETANVYITGNAHVGGVADATFNVQGGVYGGARAKGGGSTNIYMTGGLVETGLYGGSNRTGTLTGSVTMQINGGQVGTSSATANIHGGGYGAPTVVSQNVDITLGTTSQTTPGVTVYGDVYGGSALGDVNGTSAANTYHTNVTMNKGIINGSLYGGALGDASNPANVNGSVAVKVYGGSVKKTSVDGSGGVYGGNNVNGAPQRSVTVDIYGTDPAPSADEYALYAVYGGGNAADYTYGNGYPTVTVHNCDNSIEYVYGGGNAAAVAATDVKIYGGNTIGTVFGGGNGTVTPANVSGNTSVKIYGGTIGRVFGGSNSQGTIGGTISVTIEKQGDSDTDGTATPCAMKIDEVYGGGNMAPSNVGSITIGCMDDGDYIDYVYGGSNDADITGSVDLLIKGGRINNVFGGNNTGHSISGSIAVTVDWSQGSCTNNYLGNVFGGGNLATFGTTESPKAPTVNILNGTVSGNVYGGGKGDANNHTKGQVTGNPVVTIGDSTKLTDDAVVAKVLGDVYGGGDAGDVVGTPQVNVINKCNTEIGNVYGGGNAADVNGTDVNIDGGTITGMVFGGGHGDKDASPQKQADVNGDVAVDITGGTINQVFGGSNSMGTISGTVAVTIEKGANSCDMKINDVYGGGNQAAGNAGTISIGCTGDYDANGEGIVNVFGGANAADVGNDINLTIRGGHIDNVYGGNNASGSISGSVTVNVDWDDALTCGKYLGNVFGGGNEAALSGADTVNIKKGTVSHNVYGGGNKAGVGSTVVSMTGGSVLEGLYGGCNTSGTVTGNVNVSITDGTIGTDTTHRANVFGGGFGAATATEGNIDVTINGASVNIYGDVYGGSALGSVNSGTEDYTRVTLNAGTIHGDAYGGGLGNDTIAAMVNGNVTVTQNGVAFVKDTTNDDAGNTVVTAGRIFGCNNLNGSPQGTVLVLVNKTSDAPTLGTYDMNAVYGGGNLAAYEPADATLTATGQFTEYTNKKGETVTRALSNSPLQVVINGCDYVSIEYVYGGGNAAPTPSTDVLVLGAKEIGYVFGGGNGKDRYTLDGGTTWNTNPGADVGLKKDGSAYGTGNANSSLYGGLIHEAYGASNQKGTIKGSITLDVQEGEVDCPLTVEKIVGAGKNADVDGDIIMVMGCMPTDRKTDEVFGGADNANVNGNVELTITSGTFGKVFGGNNLGGIIKGHIKVNIEETGCSPIKIDSLYLGGNQAAYSIFGYYEDGTLADGRTKYSPRTSTDDSHTAITNPDADATHSFPYAQPELNVISCTRIGAVFGGGLGVGAAMYANPTVNINMLKGEYGDTIPTDNGNNPNKLGRVENVYGGGNQAAVYGNTTVNIGTKIGQNIVLTSPEADSEAARTKEVLGAYITGTVYGAGKGLADTPEAAIVEGNTLVNMAGGLISRSIYGGGELSSVGKFTAYYAAGEDSLHVEGEPKSCEPGYGLTKVLISGGQVGLNQARMPDPSNPTSDDDYGYVFCASKGLTSGDDIANKLAVSDSSYLEISGTALITASIYGGSENGQVLRNTYVKIVGGQIGTGYDSATGTWDDAYTEAQWTAAINKVKDGTFADADAAGFHECDAWPFSSNEDQRYVYDYYADDYDSKGGSKSAGNGHSFYGNVFGGGSGFYPYAAGQWRRSAGRVCGNTLVEITGGHVLTNVYGGNEITDVIGTSKVVMSGGTVGVPRTLDGIKARPVNSYIFGAGMGDPRTQFNGWSNVASSEVVVSDTAVVFGSIFGGGEDGHVLGDAKTTVKGNAHIGTFGSSGVDGNIFGSGRGFSAIALTAGVVCGNIDIDIEGQPLILGSVFGGGRLAAVGTYLADENDADHYGILQSGDAHGNVTIDITGGTIGNQKQLASSEDNSIGDVFGGSKGTLQGGWVKSQKLGLVKNTTVNISEAEGSTTTIYGNVYGGGEIASVGSYTYADATQAAEYTAAHAPEEMTVGDVYAMLDENTGLAVINITGGTIGQNSLSDTKGSVFGGCLGKSGTEYSGYSFVKTAQVTLDGGTVYGCVFGGGENGHVYKDTDVKIKSGTVGIPLDNVADADTVSNMIYRGNVYGGGRGVDKTSLNDYSLTAGKVNGNTNVTVEGGTIYRCVYGGGSLASVGMRGQPATDKTHGIATVTIKGGKIGTDGGASANDYTTLIPVRTAERENGYVYGSGRGMAAGADANATVVNMAYTRFTNVSIEGDAHVTGSVFGGGENGHVKYDTEVYVKENSLVGTELTAAEHDIDDNGRGRLIYRANVYGGGRGLDVGGDNNYSLTAGRVYGNTFVEVSGGKIYHDVFGGGSLASVGNETVDAGTGEVTYGDDSGLAQVYIKGGIIGYSENEDYWGFNCGFVYGGCRGLAAEPSSDIVKMAYVHKAEVYIQPGADIKGSVFGGGANGHVMNDTKVVISGGSIGTALKASEVGFDDHGVANAPVFRGNVYAGGRGVDQYQKDGSDVYSLTAGAVYGNAELIMTGGHVWHNVYGSGAMASVGTVEAKPADTHVHDEIVDDDGNVVNHDGSEVNYLTGVFKQNTGKVTVTITGGTVGDTIPGHEGRNNGRVYGAGRGVSANRSDLVASMEYVNETEVNIGTEGQTSYTAGDDAPYIYGAVFGGGENGHVKKDTHVNIYSGIIGWPLDEGNTGQHKTAADGSSKNPFRGHVFGGGRGVDPLYHSSTETRSSTAGRVYGHTYVTMKGGVVRRAIYGGGLLASVGMYQLSASDLHIVDKIEDEVNGGDALINISGGYIGNVDANGNALSGTGTSGYALLAPGDNNGHVFGSSCGMVADNFTQGGVAIDEQYRQMGYSHSTHVNISGGHMFGSVFGSGENGHVWEDSRINISGGEIGSETSTLIYSGNVYGSGRGVDHPNGTISETAGKVRGNTTVNMTGGTVWRDVYGGGSLASVGEADETAADSKKNDDDSDLTLYNPFPYSSGLTRVIIDSLSVVHGSVYGSGRGVASSDTVYKQAAYVKNTLVTVKGGAHVMQNVFGGGNAGHVRRNTLVDILDSAKVDGNVYGGGAGALISPTAGLVNHDVEVNIRGGIIAGDVYGGGAIANTNVHDKRNNPSLYPAKASAYGKPEEDEFAKTDVNLLGGIILGDAYGGGQGVIPASTATEAEIANAGALVRGDVTVTLDGTAFYPATTTDDQGNTIAASGRVFGCNNLNGTPQGTVLVHVKQTKGLTKSGDTYTVNANKPEKNTDTYELEAVYGGGNLAGYDPWDDTADGQFTSYTYSEGTVAHDATDKPLQVVIDGCDETSINYVYGGGNAAAAPSTDVVVIGAYEIGNVFGGGNGKDRINESGNTWTDNPGADVGYLDGTTSYGTGNALANVLGGTVHYAFGGSNTLGNVRNNAKVFIDQASDCPLNINEVYGGGNEAYMEGNSEIELGCIAALKDLYGGARNADVNGNITLTISSGTFERVFGGNNLGGKINGAITVNIEETGCHPIIIGEIYAGGNQAPYSIYGYTEKRDASNNIVTDADGKTVWEVKTSTEGTPYADPQVNAKSFTSIGTIYGGGFGESAVMAANPHVNVNVVEHADTEAQTSGEYAGETKTIGGHQVTLPSHEKNKIGAIQTIFGGGNAAKVIGNTFVNVGTLDTVDYVSLFKGEATARTGLTVKGADIRGNVYGGGNAAEVTGNTNVQIGQ